MSATLQNPVWTNVTVLTGNVVDEVTRLKQEVDGNMVVYASYQLARTLIEQDLVDELRLFVFPVVVGDGERLFGETGAAKPFRLVGSRTVGDFAWRRGARRLGDRRGRPRLPRNARDR